jgi:hypothetical protein
MVSKYGGIMKSAAWTLRGKPSAVFLVGALLIGLGLPVDARAQKQKKEELSNHPIGEGFSSPHPTRGLKVRERTFSSSDSSNPCDTAAVRATAGLRAEQSRVEVRVGEPFSFDDLQVTAVDAAGNSVGEVPILLTIKETVKLDLETYKLTGKSIRALEPGSFDVVVGFRCREGNYPTVIHYIVK